MSHVIKIKNDKVIHQARKHQAHSKPKVNNSNS